MRPLIREPSSLAVMQTSSAAREAASSTISPSGRRNNKILQRHQNCGRSLSRSSRARTAIRPSTAGPRRKNFGPATPEPRQKGQEQSPASKHRATSKGGAGTVPQQNKGVAANQINLKPQEARNHPTTSTKHKSRKPRNVMQTTAAHKQRPRGNERGDILDTTSTNSNKNGFNGHRMVDPADCY